MIIPNIARYKRIIRYEFVLTAPNNNKMIQFRHKIFLFERLKLSCNSSRLFKFAQRIKTARRHSAYHSPAM